MKFKTGPLFILMFAAVILILPALSYAQSTENNLLKFDADFRDEIGHMLIQQSDGAGGESDADSIHSVIIITDDGQEDQVEQFLQGLDAQNIFKSNSLDFLTADMPVNRLLELSEHDFIYKIGDGQKELFSQAHEGSNVIGLTMAQAKTLINADNIPSSSYPYTGRGIVVGLIDEPVDFTHPDLQNKNAGKKFCNARVCDLDSTDDSNHGTGIAGVIASNSNRGDA